MRSILRGAAIASVLAVAGCKGGGSSGPVAVAPTITSQPQGATVLVGQGASFSVTASGTAPLAYQWRRNGTAISGAASSAYSIVSTLSTDAGDYDVVVSNSAGSRTSATAALVVNLPVSVSVSGPSSVGTQSAGSYTATVTGSANTAVTWTVQEGAGGTITTAGAYTAPSAAGTYHVIATSVADPSKSATATVVVFAAGRIRVVQTGLPSGAVAAIQVTGPSGFVATTLTQQDQFLNGVPVGDYFFTIPNVASGGTTYQSIEPGPATNKTVALNGIISFGVSFAPLNPPGSGSIAAAGSALQDHIGAAAFQLPNGKVLVIGAFGAGAEEFDPATTTYANAGTPTTGTSYETNAALMTNGKVIVAGGGVGTPVTLASLYDPVPRTWSATGVMAAARMNHTVTALPNGKVLAAGGRGASGSFLNTAELYDPATGLWTAAGNMGIAREHHSATLLANGKVLLVGGSAASGSSGSAELFDPATSQFTAVVSALSVPRAYHQAVLLQNGQVVIVGGGTTKIEVFNPATSTFSAPADLKVARQYSGAAVLLDGRVFISGGMNGGDAIGSTELFDPIANTTVFGPNLSLSREEHQSLMLLNGKVFIIGGRGVNNVARRGSEYYTP